MRRVLALAAMVGLAACGDDASVGPDASADAGADARVELPIVDPAPPAAEPAMPMPPAAPAAPDFGACPPGWEAREIGDGAAHVCEPWPRGGDPACTGATGLFPSEAACVSVGDACPSGDFATELPPGRPVRYVRAGATGGDGTMTRPFGRITEALAGAPADLVVALARGTLTEDVSLASSVAIVGACAEATSIVAATASASNGVVHVTSGDVELRNVTLRGERPGLSVRNATSSLTVDGVVVDGVRAAGIVADAGAFTGNELVVRGTRPTVAGTFGRAVTGSGGAQISLTRADLAGHRDVSVLIGEAGTALALEDVVVRDTESELADGSSGTGVYAQDGTTVSLTRVVIERCRNGALISFGAPLALDTVLLRDVASVESDGLQGVGIFGSDGTEVTGSRVLVEGVRLAGARVVGVGSRLALSDSVLLDARGQDGDGGGGLGVFLESGATGRLERVLVAEAGISGIAVARAGSELVASDLVIRDVDGDPGDGSDGRGLVVQWGARAVIDRMLVERTRSAGVLAFEAEIEARDVRVREVRGEREGGLHGRGFVSEQGSALVLERASIEDAREVGLFLHGAGGTAALTDVSVSGTRADDGDGTGGRALDLEIGVVATAERLALVDNAEVAVFVATGGTSLDVTDLIVRGTAGRGASIQSGASLVARRAVFEGSVEGGVLGMEPGTVVRLEDTRITDTTANAAGDYGRAVSAQLGAHVTLERVAIARCAEMGVTASEVGTVLDAIDVRVEDVVSRPRDGTYGRGVNAQNGAAATLTRVRVERTHDIGVSAIGDGSSIVGADVDVVDTMARGCAKGACSSSPAGFGVGASGPSRLMLTEFAVRNAALCGVYVGDAAEVDLAHGEVRGAEIGACVARAGYDIGRLSNDVLYEENGVNLDSPSLPVPEPGDAPGSLPEAEP